MPLILGIENLYRSHGLTPSSEEAARPARNLLDGRRDTFWVAPTATEQTLTVDAGSGQTITPDYLALTHADRLAAVAAALHLEWSDDGTSGWTSVGSPFPLTPILTGHLLAPAAQDYFALFTATTKRAWRVRLAGTLTGPPSLAGVALGARHTIPAPRYGSVASLARAHRGGEIECEWPVMTETEITTWERAVLAATPEAPAELPAETLAGAMWGGRSHYLYEATGRLNRTAQAGTPALWHVVLMTPFAEPRYTLPTAGGGRGWDVSPLRWRQLVG